MLMTLPFAARVRLTAPRFQALAAALVAAAIPFTYDPRWNRIVIGDLRIHARTVNAGYLVFFAADDITGRDDLPLDEVVALAAALRPAD